MNALAKTQPSGGALVTSEKADAIRTALKTSLYPGASDASIDLVLAYCQASGLDPLTKPVHIVPMSVTVGKDDRGYAKKEMRDVVMPGIGLYRINAARTDAYAGCSEPEFGPMRTMQVATEHWTDGPNGKRVKKAGVPVDFQYPEWCRITVTRMVDGVAREFSAKEYWIENYATAGNDTDAPNSMWKKRPFGQLAKCTEAQALRKAFPEAVGSQPTADEMDGKDVIEGTATVVQQLTVQATPLPAYADAYIDKNLPTWRGIVDSGRRTADDIVAMLQTKASLSKEQVSRIVADLKSKPAAVDAAETTDEPAADPVLDAERKKEADALWGKGSEDQA